MKYASITVGDTVNVFFEYVDAVFNASVHHVPQATGDSWCLETEQGEIVYVQTFCKMVKIAEGRD